MKLLFIVKKYQKQNILICLLVQVIVYRHDEWKAPRPSENKVENLQVSLIFVH